MGLTEENLVALLKSSPGLDIFAIAQNFSADIAATQELLVELQTRKIVVSGLSKQEIAQGGAVFERRYFCAPIV